MGDKAINQYGEEIEELPLVTSKGEALALIYTDKPLVVNPFVSHERHQNCAIRFVSQHNDIKSYFCNSHHQWCSEHCYRLTYHFRSEEMYPQ